jgi:hypothetical protein
MWKAGGFTEFASIPTAQLYRQSVRPADVQLERLESARGGVPVVDSAFYHLETNLRILKGVVTVNFANSSLRVIQRRMSFSRRRYYSCPFCKSHHLCVWPGCFTRSYRVCSWRRSRVLHRKGGWIHGSCAPGRHKNRKGENTSMALTRRNHGK